MGEVTKTLVSSTWCPTSHSEPTGLRLVPLVQMSHALVPKTFILLLYKALNPNKLVMSLFYRKETAAVGKNLAVLLSQG